MRRLGLVVGIALAALACGRFDASDDAPQGPADAGTKAPDAAPEAGSGTTTTCPLGQRAVLFESFETATLTGPADWTPPQGSDTVAISVVPDPEASANRALRVTGTALSSTAAKQIHKDVTTTLPVDGHAFWSLSVRVKLVTMTLESALLGALELGPTMPGDAYSVDGFSAFSGRRIGPSHPASGSVVVDDRWHALRTEMRRTGATTYTRDVFLDGIPIAASLTGQTFGTTTPAWVELGVQVPSGAGDVDVYFDDVLVCSD